MPCCDVPVLNILHEFRALAGIRGRFAHRGHQPPVYDHKAEIKEVRGRRRAWPSGERRVADCGKAARAQRRRRCARRPRLSRGRRVEVDQPRWLRDGPAIHAYVGDAELGRRAVRLLVASDERLSGRERAAHEVARRVAERRPGGGHAQRGAERREYVRVAARRGVGQRVTRAGAVANEQARRELLVLARRDERVEDDLHDGRARARRQRRRRGERVGLEADHGRARERGREDDAAERGRHELEVRDVERLQARHLRDGHGKVEAVEPAAEAGRGRALESAASVRMRWRAVSAGGAVGAMALSVTAPGVPSTSARQHASTGRMHSSTNTGVAGPPSISSPGRTGRKMWCSSFLSPPIMNRSDTRKPSTLRYSPTAISPRNAVSSAAAACTAFSRGSHTRPRPAARQAPSHTTRQPNCCLLARDSGRRRPRGPMTARKARSRRTARAAPTTQKRASSQYMSRFAR